MKKMFKLFGSFLLSVAAVIIATGPTSLAGTGIEEIPESIKKKR